MTVRLTLTDEQRLLRESVARFVDKDYPFERRRELAEGDEGFDRGHWRQFAELGWLAAPLPEVHGGLGGSLTDAAVIMEELGRGLVVEPYLSCIVLAGGVVLAAGDDARRDEILGEMAAGERLLTVAFVEPAARFSLHHVETRAERGGGGFRLSGHKSVVFHAATANQIVVPARTAGDRTDRDGITLFLVDREAEGVRLRTYPTVDGHRAAELTLEGAAGTVLGPLDGGLAPLEDGVERATIAACAEAVGIMSALVERTREYLQTRTQFGRPLATFQALQHRTVDMFVATEMARGLTYRAAASAAQAGGPDLARAASAAKVQVGRGGRLVGQQAIQLHGGMGMTDALDVGHYFKRLTMIDTLFGNTAHHLDRFIHTDAGDD